MKIVTGNDLKTGEVTWWTGSEWSTNVNDAADVGADAATVIATEEAARRVVAAYAIDATSENGAVRPAHIKDRIRALGPTVRLDLSLDPSATPDQVL
ncbi:DUF2849 domain-containing protein [Novosphingobium sp. FSY-8]|uniref:DUF2849 domain-containing protein n=1 Tax=Novosphingobium ovatum TaxID=1908523 RepID=A0ABW9XEA9_9SPHN|nr:DUF2849 domain-containing protein [Novosphingobium ovatum]NBC36866.1 DUF2849 domain-containing protein [Novosphingobium ovatum]